MTEEVSLLPLALAEVERDIANTDAEVERLKGEISIREVKKQSLQKTARGLQELLGIVPAAPSALNHSSLDDVEATTRTALLPRNVFRGMSPAAAARKFLRAVGHRATHAELVEALVRGNVKSRSRYPSDSFRAAMMRRTDWFVWKKEVGHFGCWELQEWRQDNESSQTSTGTRPALSLVRS